MNARQETNACRKALNPQKSDLSSEKFIIFDIAVKIREGATRVLPSGYAPLCAFRLAL